MTDELQPLPMVVAACDWCGRGYVRIAREGVRCRYPICTGRVWSIKPISNDFNTDKRWTPIPPYLIQWSAP